jgi:hypothetical protein
MYSLDPSLVFIFKKVLGKHCCVQFKIDVVIDDVYGDLFRAAY